MARKNGLVSYKNEHGFTEVISASKVSMIYRSLEDDYYIALFDDGSDVVLDLSVSDVDNLIQRLVIVDSL